MANAKLKLTYIDLKGRAEVTRLVLAAAGKEFEDFRVTWEEWPKYKPDTPLGQVPVMEMDGKIFPQSVALANFFAREFGFYGKTNMDQLRIDIISQLAQDFLKQLGYVLRVPGEQFHEEQKHKLQHVMGPKFYDYIEAMLKETGTGWMVGDSLSVADMVVYDILTGSLRDLLQHINIEKDYPLMHAHKKRFENIERIKEYLAKRPERDL